MINLGIHFTYTLNCQIHEIWFSEIWNVSDDPEPSFQFLLKIKLIFSVVIHISMRIQVSELQTNPIADISFLHCVVEITFDSD